jgi:hypothetical protein
VPVFLACFASLTMSPSRRFRWANLQEGDSCFVDLKTSVTNFCLGLKTSTGRLGCLRGRWSAAYVFLLLHASLADQHTF